MEPLSKARKLNRHLRLLPAHRKAAAPFQRTRPDSHWCSKCLLWQSLWVNFPRYFSVYDELGDGSFGKPSLQRNLVAIKAFFVFSSSAGEPSRRSAVEFLRSTVWRGRAGLSCFFGYPRRKMLVMSHEKSTLYLHEAPNRSFSLLGPNTIDAGDPARHHHVRDWIHQLRERCEASAQGIEPPRTLLPDSEELFSSLDRKPPHCTFFGYHRL